MLFSVLTKFIASSLDGVEYSKDKKTLISAPTNLVDYIVPKTCEIIEGGDSPLKSSFIQCIDTIRNITFEDQSELRCIYPYVFKRSSLETIDMSKCVKLEYLNRSIFYQCHKLVNVFLPEGITKILAGCFYNDISLTHIKIPDSVKILEGWKDGHDSVFTCCYSLVSFELTEFSNLEALYEDSLASTRLTHLYIPKNLSSVSRGIFNTTITEFTIHPENQYFSFDGTALLSKSGDTLYYVKYNDGMTYHVPESVKYFVPYCCRGNRFKHIIFDYEIKNIDWFSFGDSALEDFTFPQGITILRRRMFDGCKNLTSVVLPDSLETIEDTAFFDCHKLTNLVMGGKINTINDMAFQNCRSLTTFTCPKNLSVLGNSVFSGCFNLKFSIGSNKALVLSDNGILYLNYVAKAYFGSGGEITMPPECECISDSAFIYSKITKITITTTETLSIGKYAFTNTSLVEVILPSCLTSIGGYAFANITTLTTITISPQCSITSIPIECFCNCINLHTITYPTEITSIGERAFAGCTLLETFDISNTKVQSIGKQAFIGTSISSLSCPSTLNFIGEEAYKNTNLVNVDMSLSNISSIEEGTFANCGSISSVQFSDSTTVIRSFAFSNCVGITVIDLPQHIVTIKLRAFEYCTKFQMFNLKHNCDLDTIEGLAFLGCNELTKIGVDSNDDNFCAVDGVLMNKDKTVLKIFLPASIVTIFVVPATIREIGSYAFHSCRNIRTLVIPEGPITSVGFHSFDGCKSLSSLIIPGTLKTFGQCAFINCPSLGCGSVHYPYEDNLSRDKALVAGIPEIAFNPNCPEIRCHTCKEFNRFSPNIISSLLLVIIFNW